MNELIRPNCLNLSYETIKGFTDKFNAETNMGNMFEFKKLLEMLGGKIEYLNMTDIETSFFMKVFNKNSFVINIPNSISKDFERFLLAQALGHYVLHSNSGSVPCIIESVSKTKLSKEAIWFALELLIPDDKFVNNMNVINDEALANLYRVPLFVVEMKKKIIDNKERESK